MKLNRFLPITLLAGVLMLAACGSNDSSVDPAVSENSASEPTSASEESSSDSASDVDSGDNTPNINQITKENFEAYLTKIKNPLCLLELNFTTDIDNVETKFANGMIESAKFEDYGDNQTIFVPKADTYDADKGLIHTDVYVRAELNGQMTWGHTEDDLDLVLFYGKTMGFVLDVLDLVGYDALVFDTNENIYKYSDVSGHSLIVKFENNNVMDLETKANGETLTAHFNNIGKTIITPPTEYTEAN